MKMMSYFVERIPTVATSFLYFSAIIYAIDRSVSRKKHSIDGWSRELDVAIKIPCHEAFNAQKKQIDKLLSFLTGDYWTLFKKHLLSDLQSIRIATILIA
jgi:hypothetical protein